MSKSLRFKTALFLVLSVLWCFGAYTSISSVDGATKYSKKSLRNVVMVDAWSYFSGNTRERYEGRFVDELTAKHFTYPIEAWAYHDYAKKLVPVETVLPLSEDQVNGEMNKEWVAPFISMLLLMLSAALFFLFQAAFAMKQRGMLYEWVEYFKEKKNG